MVYFNMLVFVVQVYMSLFTYITYITLHIIRHSIFIRNRRRRL